MTTWESGSEPATSCHNCGAKMGGNFCSTCGQRRAERIALRRIANDFKNQFVGLDFRLSRTLIQMLHQPGAVLRGYLAGQRSLYTNPFKFLFLTATLYLIVVTVLDVEIASGAQAQETATLVLALINYLVFLFLVPPAAMLLLLFKRSSYNWAESYVAVCFIWGGYLFLAAMLALIMAPWDTRFFEVRSGLGLAYCVYCFHSFYRVGWWAAIWKGALFFLAYFSSTALVMSITIFFSFLFGFELFAGAFPARP